MWKWPSIFFVLTIAVVGWMSYELGLWSYTPASANEESVASKEEHESDPTAPIPEKEDKGDITAAMESLKHSLEERTKALEKREADVNRREGKLTDKETVFAKQMERYEKLIRELSKKVTDLEGLNQDRTESFRKLYEKMEPKKVSQILEQMEPQLASYILAGMKTQLAAEILSKMSIPKIRLLTEKYLAKRILASSNKKQVNEVPSDTPKGGE